MTWARAHAAPSGFFLVKRPSKREAACRGGSVSPPRVRTSHRRGSLPTGPRRGGYPSRSNACRRGAGHEPSARGRRRPRSGAPGQARRPAIRADSRRHRGLDTRGGFGAKGRRGARGAEGGRYSRRPRIPSGAQRCAGRVRRAPRRGSRAEPQPPADRSLEGSVIGRLLQCLRERLQRIIEAQDVSSWNLLKVGRVGRRLWARSPSDSPQHARRKRRDHRASPPGMPSQIASSAMSRSMRA